MGETDAGILVQWPICGWKQTKLVWILAANSSAKHSPRHIMCAAQNGSIFSRSCNIQSRRLVNMMQDWWLIGIEKDKKLQIEESNWMNGNGMVANMRHSWVHLMAFLGLDWARIEIWWFDFSSVCCMKMDMKYEGDTQNPHPKWRRNLLTKNVECSSSSVSNQ